MIQDLQFCRLEVWFIVFTIATFLSKMYVF